MQEPNGEMIQLDFYFGFDPCADVLRDVVNHCLSHGGKYTGEVLASQFDGARVASFEGIYSSEVVGTNVHGCDLRIKLDDPNTRVVKIPILFAIGLMKKIPEIVTFSGISNYASGRDRHPIAIVSEGWVFSTPGYERESQKAGKRCYRKFVEVCDALAPQYAAILNENSLPCYTDLKRGKGIECFCDFFVNSDRYGTQVVTELESMYEDVYVERLGAGVYVSTTPVYNPLKRGIDRDAALKRSAEVARILTQRPDGIGTVFN